MLLARLMSALVTFGTDAISSRGTPPIRKPFLPVLAVLSPVSHELVDRVEHRYGRRTRSRVVEIGSPGGDRYLFPYKVDIQRDTEICRSSFGRAEYKGSASWCGSSGLPFRLCNSCTRTGSFLGCTGHDCLLLCFRSVRSVR